MKKQTITTPKIAIGILIGTALIMGMIGFMLNMVLHPVLIILVLMVLFILSMAIVSANFGARYIPAVIATFVLGWFGFNAYYKHACGPNSADVKVMKPMAQAISDYIIKHGVPESLKDIPDLPYGLVGCERVVYYSQFDNKIYEYIKVKEREKATTESVREQCNFIANKRDYYFKYRSLFDLENNTKGVTIEIGNNDSLTWTLFHFKTNENNITTGDSMANFKCSKDTGICNPMRQ
jgi:hypothetical protein